MQVCQQGQHRLWDFRTLINLSFAHPPKLIGNDAFLLSLPWFWILLFGLDWIGLWVSCPPAKINSSRNVVEAMLQKTQGICVSVTTRLRNKTGPASYVPLSAQRSVGTYEAWRRKGWCLKPRDMLRFASISIMVPDSGNRHQLWLVETPWIRLVNWLFQYRLKFDHFDTTTTTIYGLVIVISTPIFAGSIISLCCSQSKRPSLGTCPLPFLWVSLAPACSTAWQCLVHWVVWRDCQTGNHALYSFCTGQLWRGSCNLPVGQFWDW